MFWTAPRVGELTSDETESKQVAAQSREVWAGVFRARTMTATLTLAAGASGPMRVVLERLPGYRRSGSGYMARCPAHEDRTPSLAIDEGRSGNVVLKCHAGCPSEAVVAAMGLKMSDLYADSHANHGGKGTEKQTVATYTYTDAEAVPVFYRDRREWLEHGEIKKDVLPRQLDGTRKGTPPVPYRLHEVAAGIDTDGTIVLVEGEKAADALSESGYTATTTGSSTSWKPAFAEHFRGARVVLWPDADAPGEQYIADVARDLKGVAADLRVLRFEGKPKGWDAADYFTEGGTDGQLDQLLADAPLMGSTAAPTGLPDDEESSSLPLPIRAANITCRSAVEWSVQGLATAGDIGLFAGEDGSFKSTAMLCIVGAVAGGAAVFGRFQAEQGAVLWISEEDPAHVIRNRLEAICRGHGWNVTTVLGNVHVLALAECQLASTAWRLHLQAIIRDLDIKLVVLDPYAELMAGEENSNTDARPIIKAIRALTKPTGANVFVIHHFGKPFEGKRAVDRIRGASALRAASRITYTVEHDEAAHELRITNQKLSRGAKIPPFAIRYTIDSEPANPAVWTLARFDYVSVQEATLDRAEAFILDQLGAGERMTTTDLKNAAKGSGVCAADLSRALKSLEMRNRTDFVEGAKNSKLWGLVCLPEEPRQARQAEIVLAGQPDCLPGNHSAAGLCLPSPFRGKQTNAPLRTPAITAATRAEDAA